MKRFHINLGVTNLKNSITFYSSLFGKAPSVEKEDYAKWMLEDPYVNFSISTRSDKTGVDHIGIQAESEADFSQLRERLNHADAPKLEQDNVTCCYAQSSKTWIYDPDGIAWETFFTHGESTTFNDMTESEAVRIAHSKESQSTCCVPTSPCCDSN